MMNVVSFLAVAIAAMGVRGDHPGDGWIIASPMDITSGPHMHDPAVSKVQGILKNWQACQAACAASDSCKEFDFSDAWSSADHSKVNLECGTVGSCYLRTDEYWPGDAGSNCNHTSGRKPGLPPVPAPTPPPPPPTPAFPPSPAPPSKPPLGYQPNIVFILTDDQDTRLDGHNDVYSDIGSMAAQPALQKHLIAGGARMSNGFVATPICCPSRTETFTGRHLHNVWGKCMHADTTQAGSRTMGLFGRMKDQGYNVGVFGKVTNDQTRILPQITQEGAATYIDSPVDYNNYDGLPYYRLFPNGTQFTEKLDASNPVFGSVYQTTQIGNRSLNWIRSVALESKPFFAYLGPHAPHYPATPAPWYNESFPDIKIPITPNYNLSSPGKTQHIRQNPPLTELAKCWEEQHFRDRWQTLLSVDDIVADLYNLLAELDIEKKTFVVYSSDHGYKQGQWRVGTSKQHPYETDIHVPFLFSGPGIAAGTVLPHMSGNIDIMPTLLDLAGGPGAIPPWIDGKSMLPLLVPSVATARGFRNESWRDYFLIEYKSVGTYYNDHSGAYGEPACAHGQKMPRGPDPNKTSPCVESNITGGGNCYFVDSTKSNSWRNLRIINDKENIAYIEYDATYNWQTTDAKGSGLDWYELYDVQSDPYQMNNLYPTTDDATKTRLHQLMVKYYKCGGSLHTPSTCA